jgi:hypothetical protein
MRVPGFHGDADWMEIGHLDDLDDLEARHQVATRTGQTETEPLAAVGDDWSDTESHSDEAMPDEQQAWDLQMLLRHTAPNNDTISAPIGFALATAAGGGTESDRGTWPSNGLEGHFEGIAEAQIVEILPLQHEQQPPTGVFVPSSITSNLQGPRSPRLQGGMWSVEPGAHNSTTGSCDLSSAQFDYSESSSCSSDDWLPDDSGSSSDSGWGEPSLCDSWSSDSGSGGGLFADLADFGDTVTRGRPPAALRAELEPLSLGQLKRRAKEVGLGAHQDLDSVDEMDDPKGHLLDLLMEAEGMAEVQAHPAPNLDGDCTMQAEPLRTGSAAPAPAPAAPPAAGAGAGLPSFVRAVVESNGVGLAGATAYRCGWGGTCQFASTSLASIRRHVVCHTADRPFKCEHPGCAYQARQRSHLTRHQLTHSAQRGGTGGARLACPHAGCEYTSNRADHLQVRAAPHAPRT